MKGYVAQRRGRFYAVIYEGRDPVTGKEVRRWHPAGTDRAKAEKLAKKLAAAESTRVDAMRSLSFGAYLTSESGCRPRSCTSPPAPTAATSAMCSATSCRSSGGRASGGFGTSRSNRSTSRCSKDVHPRLDILRELQAGMSVRDALGDIDEARHVLLQLADLLADLGEQTADDSTSTTPARSKSKAPKK